MRTSMFKRRWWVPLLILFSPGTCYFYAAFVPFYDPRFFVTSVLIVVAAMIFATIRILQSPGEASPNTQILGAQIVTLAGLVVSIRFGLESLVLPDILVIAMVLFIYLLAWLFPYFLPSLSLAVHQEIWHPKTLWMRTIRNIFLGLGGAAGVIGARLGSGLSRNSESQTGMLIMFWIAFVSTLLGSWFVSTSILRLKKGLKLIPQDTDV